MQVLLSVAKLKLVVEVSFALYIELGCVLLTRGGLLVLLLQAERAKHTDIFSLDPICVRFGFVHLAEAPAIAPFLMCIHGWRQECQYHHGKEYKRSALHPQKRHPVCVEHTSRESPRSRHLYMLPCFSTTRP